MNSRTPFLAMLLASLCLASPLVLMGALHGGFSPWRWGLSGVGFNGAVLAVLLLTSALLAYAKLLRIALESLFWSVFDYFELQERRLLDFLLEHYRCLGSGLLLLAGCLWLGELYFHLSLPASILPLGLVLLDGVVFLRTALGALRRPLGVVLLLPLVLMIDTAILSRVVQVMTAGSDLHVRFQQDPLEMPRPASIFAI
jgi:hypothetical protein